MSKRPDELGPELKPALATVDELRAAIREFKQRDNELELAFRRYARVAAALIERGECDA